MENYTKLTKEQRKQIYLKAAERIEDCSDTFACIAIAHVLNGYSFSLEIGDIIKYFPEIWVMRNDDAKSVVFLHSTYNARQQRVMCLLFASELCNG